MDDTDAITRLQRGDIAALEILVRAHQVVAVRTAYLIVGDRHLSEDIVQAAFLRAAERIGQLRSPQAFRSWFLRSVVNDARKAVEHSRRHTALNADVDGDNHAGRGSGAAVVSPEDLVQQAESRDELWLAMQALPSAQRSALVMRYYLDLSEAEMAMQLCLPPGTVKWRLHAGRSKLRWLLRSDSDQALLQRPRNGDIA